MPEEQKKISLFKKNVLKRYEWDDIEGNKICNDYLQMSNIAEELQKTNPKAFTAFMSSLKDKIELQEECGERGKRISILQRGS